MCSLRRIYFERHAAREESSATCGEDRSIGTTCSVYRSSGCNGHVRLKVDGIARIRAMRRQLDIDREGYADVVVQDGCETGMFEDPLD